MLLNYNHLYYFHVASVEGSVAAAAQRLGVTQPTVSRQLRALEQTVGVELFERTQMGLRLTEAGRLAFLQTTPMFLTGERLAEVLANAPAGSTDLLRIGISTGVALHGTRLLAPADFARRVDRQYAHGRERGAIARAAASRSYGG